MGTLRDFRLEQFNSNVFFETGTGRGDSLKYALEGNFERIYSVELDVRTYLRYSLPLRLRSLFRNVTLLNSSSIHALKEYIPRLSPDDRVLFFLDAHYPGEHSGHFSGYKAEQDRDRRLPLERELEVIRKFREACDDVIIVDDLRIYENGPFEDGNTPDWAETLNPKEKNIDFVNRIFPGRQIRKDYRKQGYLIIELRAQQARQSPIVC